MSYDIGYDIKLVDQEVGEIKETFKNDLASYEDTLSSYLASLQRVIDGAIKDGNVAMNLTTFLDNAMTLKEISSDFKDCMNKELDNYLTDFDVADAEFF